MLVFSRSGLELSHDIPKVCLSLVSGPCDVSFLHSACCPVLYQRERVEGRRVEEALQHTQHRCPFGEENLAASHPAPPEGYSWTTQGRAPLSGGLSWARFTTVYVGH